MRIAVIENEFGEVNGASGDAEICILCRICGLPPVSSNGHRSLPLGSAISL